MERSNIDHRRTPLFSCLKEFSEKDIEPFFVPGHKYGRGLKEFVDFVGSEVLSIDIPGLPETDNLANPSGVIREAQELLAHAFGADQAYFLVNGTSEGVQVMIRSSIRPGDKIIIPRNAHKSTVGALIISGAIPVYVYPEVESELGIPTVVDSSTIKKTLKMNSDIKAVFVINPTYYGMVSDLRSIVRIAHKEGAVVLADEAHGAHMHFHSDFPITGMEAGADMSAASLHKTCGSMTQSSVLLCQGDHISSKCVERNLNLTRTTSPSYVLMSSVDVARKQLALQGKEMLGRTLELARYAKSRINEIKGLYAFNQNVIGRCGVYGLDDTKLGIHVSGINITGFELERELMTRFGVGLEMAELDNVLALITLGDSINSIEKLINALQAIAKERGLREIEKITQFPDMPDLIVTPRDAYYAIDKNIPLHLAVGEISAEMLMAYPPGIPIICPGERITQEIVDYIKILKEQHAHLQGTDDPLANYIRVLKHSYKIKKIG
ncbi:MAG: aminotransferase class V-fold PLP-dependent enzyme [Halanaerobiales bacterium]|nr:aminotransferase class V-fold PLP-dependent enzyme [Halanaerobiales bacterium]